MSSYRPSAPRDIDVDGSNDDDDHNSSSAASNIGRRLIGLAADATATAAACHNDGHLQLPASTNLPALLTDATAPSDAHHAGSAPHHLLLPADDVPLHAATTTTAAGNLSHGLSRLRHDASPSSRSDHAVVTDHAAAHVDDNFNEHCTSHHDGPHRTSGHVTATSTTTTRGDEPEFDIGL